MRVGMIWLVVENWVGGGMGWNWAFFGSSSNIGGLSKSIKKPPSIHMYHRKTPEDKCLIVFEKTIEIGVHS